MRFNILIIAVIILFYRHSAQAQRQKLCLQLEDWRKHQKLVTITIEQQVYCAEEVWAVEGIRMQRFSRHA